jgi:hypothetical protein
MYIQNNFTAFNNLPPACWFLADGQSVDSYRRD